MEFNHIPVLLEETIASLDVKPDGLYVDATVGGGGHSRAIVEQLTEGRLLAMDQDEEALAAARQTLAPYADKVSYVHDNFRNIAHAIDQMFAAPVDGILFDIGVSSYQLDNAERGFSYQEEGVLDMRMDQNAHEKTARDIVNTYSESELTQIFYQYGEERWAKRIAAFIVDARNTQPLETSTDLVRIIKQAIPKKVRMQDKHPARRIFQALRIEVNHELDVLEEALDAAITRLKPGGRLAVITFHSLEDRVVKNRFREWEQGPELPPGLPIRAEVESLVRRVNRKPIVASEAENESNPRARSAKLRVVEKK
ncbi:MAG: 16S rRNA (cytosine(1402)-N(4))-methyltransferase RsmH [Peptoniphilaceae bacterium]|nr:16S rRNA (cytosine(1402)-N(4))-methyltransferase RsmH [Peptoniphilaceae bacterium]MDY6085619.1 16S rRNA (cytosine(1402)-N(4))-methyltransferase RsmH [Peptoniphilaceae bacterium]